MVFKNETLLEGRRNFRRLIDRKRKVGLKKDFYYGVLKIKKYFCKEI